MNDVWKRVSIKRKAIEYKIHRIERTMEDTTYIREDVELGGLLIFMLFDIEILFK